MSRIFLEDGRLARIATSKGMGNHYNMVIKAGTIYPFDEDPTDAQWDYENGGRVLIRNNDYIIVSIDPEDFLAVADAIRGNIMFHEKLKNDK